MSDNPKMWDSNVNEESTPITPEKRARVLDTLEALGDRLTTPDPALALVPAPPPEENPTDG